MNRQSFKTVFSKRLGCLVAVGEHTASQGKANGAGEAGGAGLVRFVGLLAAGFASVSLAWAQPASNALPSAGVVAQGAASISTSGAVMNIQQSTPKAVLNWNSFDIGRDARVNIQQPGADAVMLNRVTGANPSQIFGQLSANGQVVLVNPNGVMFGKDGSVTATSFTASTLGISDANFMGGNMLFERNGSAAGVVNQGSLKATGGYVALLGASVSNEGKIETSGAAAYLAAAETVKVPLGSTGRIKLELSPSSINAAVSNSKEGTIVTHGGQVYMQAAALKDAVASIIHSGSIDSTAEQGGAVHLLADGGQIRVSGSIKANSTNGTAGGDIYIGRDKDTNVLAAVGDASGAQLESQGGFVETSGQFLKVDGARVIAKDWLLDPFNITIGGPTTTAGAKDLPDYTPSATSNISVADILTSLNTGTNVKISTGLAGTNGNQDGNITVNANIVKDSGSAATLTLEANNRITINNGFKITDKSDSSAADGTGNLGVHLIANGDKKNGASIVLGNDAAIDVGGKVEIDATSATGTGLGGAAIYMALGTLNKAGDNGGARTYIRGSEVDIDMKLSGNNTWGLFTQNATGIEATTGDVKIAATYSGNSSSGKAVFMGSGWNASYAPASVYLKATNGSVSVESKTAGTNADGTLSFSSVAISALNNITLKAESGNAASTAINVSSEFGNAPSIKATNGDVLIRSTQGSIQLGSLGNESITGNNIVIDNTGGSLNTTSGLYEKGSGTFTGNTGGSVSLSGGGSNPTVKAAGKIDIIGVGTTKGSVGVVLNSAVLRAVDNLSIQGENVGPSDQPGLPNGVFTNSAIISGGDVSIRGTSKTSSALSLQGTITAANNVIIHGVNTEATNARQAVFINKAVTATNGTIEITAETVGTTDQALRLNTGALLNTSANNTNITLKTDSLSMDTNSAVINAGEGAVTIKTASADAKIDIGSGTGTGVSASGVDAGSTATGARTLGLSKGELDRITASNTIIGDTSNTGGITVSAATTTAEATGHISLETGKDINVNAALAAANGKDLTLKAIGDINVNRVISQGGTGKIVLAAGYGLNSGNGGSTTGQVKQANVNGKVNNTNGKTYIYTGSVANSAVMSALNSTEFGTLTLGTNAQSFTDSNGTSKIGADSASMQVMYREKITVDFSSVPTFFRGERAVEARNPSLIRSGVA